MFRYLSHVRILLNVPGVLVFMMVITGCAGKTTSDDFIPPTVGTLMSKKVLEGSVNVQSSVPEKTSPPSYPVEMDVSRWVDGNKLKVALEKTITQNSVFSKVEQGTADYVLDVWVESIQSELKVVGEGFMFDMTSIWRLTRAKDGKVLVCDFVKGHGASHGFGSSAYPPSLSAAVREMIQNGLSMLVDQSYSHISAISKAGLRPHMGPAVP